MTPEPMFSVDTDKETGNPEPTKQQRFSASLREVADFYDSHPDCPVETAPIVFTSRSIANEDEFKEVAAKLGTFDKEVSDYYFTLVKKFGYCQIRISVDRQTVCTRRKVGTKVFPSHYIAEYTTDVYEWNCPDYLLSSDKEQDHGVEVVDPTHDPNPPEPMEPSP